MGHLNLFMFSTAQHIKGKNEYPKHQENTLSVTGSSFCIKWHPIKQGLIKVTKILTTIPCATSFSFTDNFKYITPWQILFLVDRG